MTAPSVSAAASTSDVEEEDSSFVAVGGAACAADEENNECIRCWGAFGVTKIEARTRVESLMARETAFHVLEAGRELGEEAEAEAESLRVWSDENNG